MQQYPTILGNHKKTLTFKLDDKVFHLYDHLAYFHDDEFPLYMHSHDFYEINIITRGKGRHYIENNNFAAAPGDVFAIPPHIKHGYWAENNQMSIFHLLISEDLFSKFHNVFNQFSGVQLLFETEPQIRRNLDRLSLFLHLSEEQLLDFLPKIQDLVQLATNPFPNSNIVFEMRAVCLICELANLISMDYQSKRTDCTPRNSVYSLIPTAEYMNENYGNHITLTELAKIAMLSPASYIRHFKKLFGMPPVDYLIQLRIKHASEMLRNTDKSATSIAQDCGFFDCSHMTRVFKKLSGKHLHNSEKIFKIHLDLKL